MVSLPQATPDINLLSQVLNAENPAGFLSRQDHDLLIKLGAVTLLEQMSPQEAVPLLFSIASANLDGSIKFTASQILTKFAFNGVPSAIDALFSLALEFENLPARQQILAAKLVPTMPTLQQLLQGLIALEGEIPIRNDELQPFSEAVLFSAGPSLQERIIFLARETRLRHWADLIDILRSNNPQRHPDIVGVFQALSEKERSIAIYYLSKAAIELPSAREVLCQLFLVHEDRTARDISVSKGYSPEDPTQRALFLFLTEQWDLYSQIDVGYTLIINAYESGNRSLRRRILAFSRQTGKIEWLREISRTADIRWLGDLTDADWELTIDRLTQTSRLDELWRLALSAPAIWSVRILVHLQKVGWKAPKTTEQDIFTALSAKALECAHQTLELQPTKAFHALTGDLTCLAINDRANLLAAGSSGQALYLWQLPEGDLRLPAFMGPATTTRSVLFSPDSEYLAAASGDQRIRIIKISNNQIIKTIEGHRNLVRALAIHHGGRVLVSAGFDGTIRFWRFPHGTELKVMRSPVREIFCLALLHRDDIVASAGAGAEISFWKIPEGTLLRQLYAPASGITHLAASRTSDLLAAVSKDRSLTVWNTTSGSIIRQWNNLTTTISGCCFHSDDQVLITSGSDGWITLWSITTGRQITRLKDPSAQPLTALTSSPDGEWLVSSNAAGRLHLWNLATFLWSRRPNQPGSRLNITHINKRLSQPSLSPAERPWLLFLIELTKWSQRFDIELADTLTIPVGEFDIEL
jgi:WD40 repeat protein